jgi:hypothetical protein
MFRQYLCLPIKLKVKVELMKITERMQQAAKVNEKPYVQVMHLEAMNSPKGKDRMSRD